MAKLKKETTVRDLLDLAHHLSEGIDEVFLSGEMQEAQGRGPYAELTGSISTMKWILASTAEYVKTMEDIENSWVNVQPPEGEDPYTEDCFLEG